MIYALPLLAPLLLAYASYSAFKAPGLRPRAAIRFAELAALASILVALLSSLVLALYGPGTSPMIGYSYVALASRLDLVSLVMLLLVSFIGWVVLRYAGTFLDGEARQGPFTGWMTATLAAVLLLVQSGTLLQLVIGWCAASLLLHQLLIFYPERIAARRAARKKFFVSRLGDLALIGAVILLATAFKTGDIATILAEAQQGQGLPLTMGHCSTSGCRCPFEVCTVPHPWMADGSHGDANTGFCTSPCGRRQCRRLPADPLCRCHACWLPSSLRLWSWSAALPRFSAAW